MKVLRTLLRLLTTGSVSFMIAACYGVPVLYGDSEATLRVRNQDGAPVTGLRVNTGADYSPEYYYTDENGEVKFFPILHPETNEPLDPIIRDIDGPENLGCFARTEVSIDDRTEIEVTIQPNQYRYADAETTCRFVTESGEPIPGLLVSLGEFGCNPDEFVTDENGSVTFHPLLGPDGSVGTITVTDTDFTETIAYFGTGNELTLGEGASNEYVLVAESTAEDATTQSNPADESADASTATE